MSRPVKRKGNFDIKRHSYGIADFKSSIDKDIIQIAEQLAKTGS